MNKKRISAILFFTGLLLLAVMIYINTNGESQRQAQLDKLTSKTTFYIGKQKKQPAMVEGQVPIDDHHPDGGRYWKTMLTVNGKKQAVVAFYERMGFFTIYTTEPTDKDQGFNYSGLDYKDYIGKQDLDDLRSKSTPNSKL